MSSQAYEFNADVYYEWEIWFRTQTQIDLYCAVEPLLNTIYGHIEDAAVYNQALSIQEIEQLWQNQQLDGQ